MARLNVRWTLTAIKQRNQVFEYWNDRNKSTSFSIKLNHKIKERLTVLKTNPLIGKQTEYKDTRVISLGHYSILYKQIEHNLIITGFWDNRQNPKTLLDYLKNN